MHADIFVTADSHALYIAGSGAEELAISYNRDSRDFCIFCRSTTDPKFPIKYRATITIYSENIWTSETMLTPQCIDIPVEFHHSILCSPFNLTLYLMDSFEEEIQGKQLGISKCRISLSIRRV